MSPIEFGRYDEFFQRPDRRGRRHHGIELMGKKFAARHRHVAPECKAGALRVRMGHIIEPLGDAQRLPFPHCLDTGVPTPAHAVDALDQLRERENVGRLQMAGQRRIQPGGNRIAGLGRLGNLTFKPAQRLQLARNQLSTPAQSLRCTAIFGFISSDLLGLALVFQTVRFGKRFQAWELQ